MDHSKFNHITTLVFDVDGVFTNSNLLVTEDGELLRTMNTRDGQGVKFALDKGYNVAIMTKGNSKGVRKRLEGLGIVKVYDELTSKLDAFSSYTAELNLKSEEILFMGDDIPDLALFPHVGVAACPRDAAVDVLNRADFIAHAEGGCGCVREVIEKVLRIRGDWVV